MVLVPTQGMDELGVITWYFWYGRIIVALKVIKLVQGEKGSAFLGRMQTLVLLWKSDGK